MAKVTTTAIYHARGHNPEARTMDIEVLGDIVFLRVGRSTVSLPYDQLLRLFEAVGKHRTPDIKVDVDSTIIPANPETV